jgi:uncharacterized membrane protein YccC
VGVRGWLRLPAWPPRAGGAQPPWLPVWSTAAALRALRTTLVVPGLFALTYKVIGNPQMATFAAFGGFATLVMAAFGGTRRDKAVAHLGLALVGSVLLVIGTAVNSSTALAALVTLPVAFAVLFAGVAGPNVASAGTAALLAFVLPAASPGTMDMVPSRLAGWWIASVAGTAAVLLLSPRPPGRRLELAAAATARALVAQLEAALRGDCSPAHRAASVDAKHQLMAAFTATPFRPTGLATTEQALGNLIGMLEWCAVVVCDSVGDGLDLRRAPEPERRLLAGAAEMLDDVARLLEGGDARPDLDALEQLLEESRAHLRQLQGLGDGVAEAVHLAFHARTAATAALAVASDALIATGRADAAMIAARRRRWYGMADGAVARSRLGGLTTAGGVVLRHASLRSVWFLNSVRGAVALAAAVAVADLSGVQHGFWVVLGTLSVLRTNAAGTGSTALRALVGTAAGFVVGAALILAIGTGAGALWAAFPIAVLVASYAPGAAPFAVGQAAFTVLISILYNLLVPAGWTVGVARIEDVAIGCAVSLLVGALFWPRGAAAVVADDLADAYRRGATFLTGAVDWALGRRPDLPPAAPAVTAGLRLDDALRGFLAEQGAKRLPQQDLWRLVSGTMRLRLTANSLTTKLPAAKAAPEPASAALGDHARRLASWYGHLAAHLGRPGHDPIEPLGAPAARPLDAPAHGLSSALWVDQHLRHIEPHLGELVEPAERVATVRRAPWWR